MKSWGRQHRKIILFFIVALIIGGVFAVSAQVLAQTSTADLNFGLDPIGQNTGLAGTDIRTIIAKIIRAVLGFLGVLALAIMLYGGFIYMTAGGNEEKVLQAKKILINGVIGLVIILSSFAIAQFVINKLSEATGIVSGGGGDGKDPNSGFPPFCATIPIDQWIDYPDCCADEFFVKSITPSTEDTGMNNVSVRALFSRELGQQFDDASDIFDIVSGEDISNKFNFSFLKNKDSKVMGVEAKYDPNSGTCPDAVNTPCMDFGNFEVEVRDDLMSQDGLSIVTSTDCGNFPLNTEFMIGSGDSKSVLKFDGEDDYVDTGYNPIEDGDLTLEAWFYPTEKKNGYIFEVSSSRYYLRYKADGGLHFRLAESYKDEEGNNVWNPCDASTAANTVPLNQWHHVVAVFDSQAPEKRQTIYVDGEAAGFTTDGKDYEGCKKLAGAGPLALGAGLTGPGYQTITGVFTGYLGSACVYNSVLPEEKILEHFAEGLGSCGAPGENSLVAGWGFDEGQGDVVSDYSGNDQDGDISGAVWKELDLGNGEELDKVVDNAKPKVDPLAILGTKEIDGSLKLNKVYSIETDVNDNSGVGYTYLRVDKDTGDEAQAKLDHYHGPSHGLEKGSDAPPADPFEYVYKMRTPSSLATDLEHYTITLDAYDIDNNLTTVTSSFVLGETLDVGDACTEDWQCKSGKCVDGQCIAQPRIFDVDPMDGAEGNWITLTGLYFGTEQGHVQFAIDEDDSGDIDQVEWESAVVADLAECGTISTWNDNWIIVEVPGDEELAQGTSSSIRVVRQDDASLWDSTTDNWGEKPGKGGWFEKNDIQRPGLCSVATQDGKTAAMPKTPVDAIGAGLGDGNGEQAIRFGGVQAGYVSWTDTKIETSVPENMGAGVVAVKAEVEGKFSNGIPFTIITEGDLPDYSPVITLIDPKITTAGSFITIYGTGFDSSGHVYIATDAGTAHTCAEQNSVNYDNDKEPECIELKTKDLHEKCPNTWKKEQIIAQIPLEVLSSQYYLSIRNGYNFFTKADDYLEEEDMFEVKEGPPLPSICKLEPDHGSAPLLGGKTLDIYGNNFVLEDPVNTVVHFWRGGAEPLNLSTWLDSKKDFYLEQPVVVLVDNGHIETALPVSEIDGNSMQSGPIKVSAKGEVGNSAKYTVSDCRNANDDVKNSMDEAGNQCCAGDASPDAGLWKPKSHICAGETRDAGYAWRFTTGKIKKVPRVLEECNEVDWFNNVDVEYPSPVPSTLWSLGKETCLNATIAVKFSMPMDENTLNGSTIKIYQCGGTDLAINCKKEKKLVPPQNFDYVYFPSGVLEIRRKTEIPGDPQPDLDADAWYRVELSEEITSSQSEEILGQEIITKEKLLKTNPCVVGAAYCFEFKTGNGMCKLKQVSIVPKYYVAHLLGLILDPAYPVSSIPQHPYYYYIWGRGSQECVVLNVDGLGWKWGSTNPDQAVAVLAPKPPYFTDSRAIVTAKEDTGDDTVKITANIEEVNIQETTNVLKKIGAGQVLEVNSVDDVKVVEELDGADFVEEDSYVVTVKYNLDKISTSTHNFTEVTEAGEISYWWIDRYIYFKQGASKIHVVERHFPGGKKERGFVYEEAPPAGDIFLMHWEEFDGQWDKGDYKIMKTPNGISLYIGESDEPFFSKGSKNVNEIMDSSVAVGGAYAGNGDIGDVLFGNITELKFTKQVGSLSEGKTATSTLKIDLYDPEVVEWWPNCGDACINTGLGFRFNRQMVKDTYQDGIKLEKCHDETCQFILQNIPLLQLDSSDNFIARLSPTNWLEPSTWYQVRVETSVKAIGGFDPIKPGKSLKEEFVDKFRTKDSDTPCAVDKVDIKPDPFTAYLIGQKQKYTTIPRGEPDACSPYGQELNPWWYGWEWKSGDNNVATVTKFTATKELSPECDLTCMLKGSDVLRSANPSPYLCGNAKLEPGEDCEPFGAEEPGVSCSLSCLRPGSTEMNCGNGELEPYLGEECDPGGDKEEWVNCNVNCTNSGSPNNLEEVEPNQAFCGSKDVAAGEDCDIGITQEMVDGNNWPVVWQKQGCSDECLHLGTPMAQSWCIDNPDYMDEPECQESLSVCGNYRLELGEECEVMPGEDNAFRVRQDGEGGNTAVMIQGEVGDYCTDSCLVQNLCEFEGFVNDVDDGGVWCEAGTDGCKDDCTLWGSSVAHHEPSLCRDAVKGPGEYQACEIDPLEDVDEAPQTPVQLVTAEGDGVVNDDGLQETTINAKAVSFMDLNGEVKSLDQKPSGAGEYFLQCGYTEYEEASANEEYNDCLSDNPLEKTKWGVGNNSCCYERLFRTDEYPVDGAGLEGTEDVCRNTYIEVKFPGFINPDTISGDLLIAHGHEEGFVCADQGELNVTDIITPTLSLAYEDSMSTGSWWQKAWNWFKKFFVRAFGDSTYASEFSVDDIKVWCSGSITAVPETSYEWSDDYQKVTSTISIYLQDLLPVNTVMAVILQGGNDGIAASNGAGIKSPEKDILVDSWIFETGTDICKMEKVVIEPDSWIFETPFTSSTFRAIPYSTNGQQIVRIPGQYYWVWDWQPQANPVLDIPAPGHSTSTALTAIGSRNVEGHITAVANAEITDDVDVEDNQFGEIFTGLTEIDVILCENPWPPKQYYPFEEGITFGNLDGINESGWDENGQFNGTQLLPIGGPYYNFRMSYCADAGQSDNTGDDLPFLKPFLVKEGLGTGAQQPDHCAYSNDACQVDSECPDLYLMPNTNGPDFDIYFPPNCKFEMSAQELLNNNCVLTPMPKGSGYCSKVGEYPIDYDKDWEETGYRSCFVDDDCHTGLQEQCMPMMEVWKVEVDNSCVETAEEKTTLTEDTLKRYLLFSNNNDDVIGIQIFNNTPDRLTPSEWFKKKFPDSLGMQPIEIAGYQGITDGDNYYINALNIGDDDSVYNNIYQFSINQNAQASTRDVFEQLINSLEFNINVSDFGYCLKQAVEPDDQLPDKAHIGTINSFSCVNDFDCNDADGLPLEDSNGVCSNAKTKLFRDWERLPEIRAIMTGLYEYARDNKEYPSLDSGTFITGYTVSKWPSWGNVLGGMVNNLVLEKINQWTSCDPEADQETCWSASKQEYSCPVLMSAFEYEAVDNGFDYKLHGNLEYLTVDSPLFKETINPPGSGDLLDLDKFTTERWCKPNEVKSPFDAKCGDGVINVLDEECEPPGTIEESSEGKAQVAMSAKCEGGISGFKQHQECESDLDCGLEWNTFDGKKVNTEVAKGVCAVNDSIIYDLGKYNPHYPNDLIGFGCDEAKDFKSNCDEVSTYMIAGSVQAGDSVYYRNAGPGKKTYVDLVKNPRIRCVYLKGETKNGKDDFFMKNNRVYPASDCVGGVEEGDAVSCTESQSAYKFCTNSCEWMYSSCKDKFECDNGIVEGGEACDDGALNGTYGHCNSECTGLSAQQCGDGVKDFDANGAPLEFCDLGEDKYQLGYCSKIPFLGDTANVCAEDQDCFSKTDLPLTDYYGCEQNKYKMDGETLVLCDANEANCVELYDCGPCVGTNDSSYNANKEYSCSWDCKDNGGYCGDGIVNGIYEGCDDTNTKELDGCNNFCQKENMDCKDANPMFTTTTDKTYIDLVKDYAPFTMHSECKQGTTGNEICNAYGLICSSVEKKYVSEAVPGIFNWGPIPTGDDETPCQVDLTDVDFYYSSGSLMLGNGGRVVCDGVYQGTPPVPEEPTGSFCGNGKVENSPDLPKEKKEACDMGTQNGIKCDPEYNKSCTYCSSDCKEVLTIDSMYYCGNGEIDKEGGEECDFSDGKVLNSHGNIATCSDKGEWLCLEDCTELENKCIECGFSLDDGAEPFAHIMNAAEPNSERIGWPVVLGAKSNTRMIYGEEPLDPTNIFEPFVVSGPQLHKNIFYKLSPITPKKLVTNKLCNAPGASYFLQFTPNTSPVLSEMLFPFPVNNESEKVINEYVISPPVPEDTFRVVLKWTKKDKAIDFGGTVHNEGFSLIGGTSPIKYPTVVAEDAICDTIDYLTQCTDETYNGVYVHEAGHLEETYVQSVTIDTSAWPFKGYNYAFTVEQFTQSYPGTDVKPITNFVDSNIIVEVYKNKWAQDELSVYKPDYVFHINDAEPSGNKSAQYWHVFDLVFNQDADKYQLEEVSKVRTDDQAILDSIGDSELDYDVGEGVALVGTEDVGDFFFDDSEVDEFMLGDLAFISKVPRDSIKENYLVQDVFSPDYNFIVERVSSWLEYSPCMQPEATPLDFNQCYGKIKSGQGADYKGLIFQEDGCDGSFLNPCLVEDVKLSRLVKGATYRYIFQHKGSTNDGGLPIKDILVGELPYELANFLGEEGPVFKSQGIEVYLGFGNEDNEFVLNKGVESVKPYAGDHPLRLNYFDYDDLDDNDTQWYVLSVLRTDDDIFINVVDKFLPTSVDFGDYANYDFN